MMPAEKIKQNNLLVTCVLAMLIAIPFARVPGFVSYVEPTKFFLFILILVLWGVSELSKGFSTGKWISFQDHPLRKWFLCFTGWLMLTTVTSVDVSTSLYSFAVQWTALSYFFIFWILLKSSDFRQRSLDLLLWGGVIASAVALLQIFVVVGRFAPFLEPYIIPASQRVLLQLGEEALLAGFRSAGTFFHPNSLATFLTYLIPFAIVLCCFARDIKKKIVLGVCAVLFILALLCTGSRGGILSALVSGAFLLWVFWPKVSKGAVLLVLILISIVAGIFSERLSEYLRIEQGLSSRQVIWQHGFEMLAKDPWLGIGPGMFPGECIARYGFPSEQDFMIVLNELTTTGSSGVLSGFTAHNFFLNYAVEMGVMAAALVFGLYVIYFVVFVRWWKARKDRDFQNNALIVLAATAAVAGNFAQAFFEASINFALLSLGITFVWVMSMGLVAMKETGQDRATS